MKITHPTKPLSVDASSLYVRGNFACNISGQFGSVEELVRPLDAAARAAVRKAGLDPAGRVMLGKATLDLETLAWVKAAHAQAKEAERARNAKFTADAAAAWDAAAAKANGRVVVRLDDAEADGAITVFVTRHGKRYENPRVEALGDGFFALIEGAPVTRRQTTPAAPATEADEAAAIRAEAKIDRLQPAGPNDPCPRCGTWCHGDCETNG